MIGFDAVLLLLYRTSTLADHLSSGNPEISRPTDTDAQSTECSERGEMSIGGWFAGTVAGGRRREA
jgi:hypothetical protein